MNAFYENLLLALDALRANKLRSLLTTLGIIIGIMTVIAIISVIQGLNLAFSDEIETIGSGVLYVQQFPWASEDWYKYRKNKKIDFKEYRAIKDNAKLVEEVAPITGTAATVKYGKNKLTLVQIVGTTREYQTIRNVIPAAGRGLTPDDISHNRGVVVIGWEVAKNLFKEKNPIGERVWVEDKAFNVVGILEKRGAFFDQNLDQIMLMPIGAFRKSFGIRRSISVMIKVKDPSLQEQTIDEITSILRRVRKVPFEEENDFFINQIDVLKDLYDKLTSGLYAAMFGVAAISLLVGGIGIMNIMLVSVVERTREIGIRKALGAKNRDILLQFLIEAILLSAVGGFFGILAGFGVAKLVAAVSPVPASVELWSVFLGLAFSSVTGIGFGIFPAMKAAKKHPVEALSFE